MRYNSSMRNSNLPKTKLKAVRFKKTIFVYGFFLFVLIIILRFFEYRYMVRDLSVEVYISVVAILFTALGIWIGLKLLRKKTQPAIHKAFELKQDTVKDLKISNREYEVLELISQGMSNQEIADKLFISLPTVKTHSSRLFEKLNVQRRTQAIRRAKELQILP